MMEMGILNTIKRAFRPKDLSGCYSERLSVVQNLIAWESYHEVIDILQSTILQNPHNYVLHYHLGEAYRLSNQKELAIKSYQAVLKIDPTDPLGVSIRLSNWGCIEQPETLPITYIQNLFDQYAPSFEQCLIKNLDYKAPELTYDTIQSKCPDKKFNRILDLGCGTGLSSSRFYSGREWIEGVDISQNMLNEASRKNIFKRLHHASVFEFLNHSDNQFDLILALDFFIYLGKMEDYFALIRERKSAEGIFAFTIQNSDKKGFVLGEDGRYSHDHTYVMNCTKLAGLDILYNQSFTLRKEHGKDVAGMLYLCK